PGPASFVILAAGGAGQPARRGAQLRGPFHPSVLPLVPRRTEHQQIAGLRDQQSLTPSERPGLVLGRFLLQQAFQGPEIRHVHPFHEELRLGDRLQPRPNPLAGLGSYGRSRHQQEDEHDEDHSPSAYESDHDQISRSRQTVPLTWTWISSPTTRT